MRAARFFVPIAITLTMLGNSAPARAGIVVLSNLDQLPPEGTSADSFVGQSFISGSVDQTLFGAEMLLGAAPDSNITLEVEASNSDGTVGATLFSDFTWSYDATTQLVTFTANSSFVLTAGTGYWLVLSDPTTGGVTWDFTASQAYASSYGYGLSSYNTSWTSTADNGMGGVNSAYFLASAGPQMFALNVNGSAVPEPSTYVLLSIAMTTLGFVRWVRKRMPGFTPRPI